MAKKILFTVISLVLAYNTYKLILVFFALQPTAFSIFGIVLLAVVLNFTVTGVVAFLGFVYPTSRILGKNYYRIKKPMSLNKWYKWLGVHYFRVFLLKTFYREKDNKKYFNGTKSGVLLFDYNTKQSEFGHLASMVLVFVLSLILLSEGHTYMFLSMQPVNIFLNLYPVILQRKHRMVVERLMSRSDFKV